MRWRQPASAAPRPTAATRRWRWTRSCGEGASSPLYNDVVQVLIGETGPWDQIAIMQYPGIDAFVDMIRDQDYQVGLVHRDAGLAGTAILVSRSLL